MREELKALNGSRDALRGQLRDLKTKLGPYVTVQKIDERLQALEHRLSHTTVDLKDELRVISPPPPQPQSQKALVSTYSDCNDFRTADQAVSEDDLS